MPHASRRLNWGLGLLPGRISVHSNLWLNAARCNGVHWTWFTQSGETLLPEVIPISLADHWSPRSEEHCRLYGVLISILGWLTRSSTMLSFWLTAARKSAVQPSSSRWFVSGLDRWRSSLTSSSLPNSAAVIRAVRFCSLT